VTGIHHRSIVRLTAAALAATIAAAGCDSGPSFSPDDLGPNLSETEGRRIENALRDAKRGYKAKEPERAEQFYTSAVRQYAEFGAAWNNLGVALMEQERFVEASEAFDRAAELSPDDPRPPNNRGQRLHKRGYIREAQPHFEESLQRDPAYLNALRSIISSHVRLRETDRRTLELVGRALMLEVDPDWRDFFTRQRLRIEAELESAEAEAR
jgi:tetratricopeptide (TPR) repeat protein